MVLVCKTPFFCWVVKIHPLINLNQDFEGSSTGLCYGWEGACSLAILYLKHSGEIMLYTTLANYFAHIREVLSGRFKKSSGQSLY